MLRELFAAVCRRSLETFAEAEDKHSECRPPQPLVGGPGSRSRSQDTLLLSVSIYHKSQVKEQARFLYPSTSHSAELFCRTITNKGNLCTAKARPAKRK